MPPVVRAGLIQGIIVMSANYIAVISAWAAIGFSVLQLLRTVCHELLRPRPLIFEDEKGAVLGQLSSDSVQQTDVKDLERLHERIRRAESVHVKSAA